jgi:peptidoglycan/xylan/chitin deacetylase (PgdA/CDA1 family)
MGHKTTESSALVLTFDDGPGNRLTPANPGLLGEHKVKASFFLRGTDIIGREKIVRQIAE